MNKSVDDHLEIADDWYDRIQGNDGNKLMFYAFFNLAMALVKIAKEFLEVYKHRK